MQVFSISVKVEQDGIWSNKESDFAGYFEKREYDDVITGYVEETNFEANDVIRYLKGLYNEKGQIVFLKMTNNKHLKPLAYTFPNVNEQGFWSIFDCYRGFFPKGCHDGHATIKICEITDESQKERISKILQEAVAFRVANATQLNQDLLNDADSLVDFLDENSIWFPKD